MTEDEALELQPGDKVVFVEPWDNLRNFFTREIQKEQEKNGGYLTVKEMILDPLPKEQPIISRIDIYLKEGDADYYYFPEELELYEKEKPWSYERDY
jgi:hypothetical protein